MTLYVHKNTLWGNGTVVDPTDGTASGRTEQLPVKQQVGQWYGV